MLERHDFAPVAEIAALLATLCREGRSGYLYLTTATNHTATIGLAAGEVCALHYRIRKGAAALAALSEVTMAKYRFEPTAEVVADGVVPPTAEVLALWGGAPSEVSGGAAAAPVSEAQLARITAALTEVIGPMAQVVAQSAAAQARDRDELIALAAQKIPDPAAAARFVAIAQAL